MAHPSVDRSDVMQDDDPVVDKTDSDETCIVLCGLNEGGVRMCPADIATAGASSDGPEVALGANVDEPHGPAVKTDCGPPGTTIGASTEVRGGDRVTVERRLPATSIDPQPAISPLPLIHKLLPVT